jgi:uncharacterized protein
VVYTAIVKFEWDNAKSKLNLKKHGISFEDSVFVFSDFSHIKMYDHKHSKIESRYNIIGFAPSGLLFVVYVVRINEVYRLISARKANKKEKFLYEEKNNK